MKVEVTKKVVLEPKTISIYLKVSVHFFCQVLDGDEILKEHDGYVPDFMPGDHYGDYVDLHIDLETGKVLNWRSPDELKEYLATFLSEKQQ